MPQKTRAAGGINVLGIDTVPSAQTQHIHIRNNLLDDIGTAAWGGNGIFLQVLNGANDIVVDHNTAFPSHTIITAGGAPSTGLVFQNNITTYGSYGIKGTGTAPGDETLSQYFPGAVVGRQQRLGRNWHHRGRQHNVSRHQPGGRHYLLLPRADLPWRG
jgi:hypothetical protein